MTSGWIFSPGRQTPQRKQRRLSKRQATTRACASWPRRTSWRAATGHLRKGLDDNSFPPLQKNGPMYVLNPPADLRRRLGAPTAGHDVIFGATAIPEESWPEDGHLYLTTDPERVDQSIRAALAQQGQWSQERKQWDGLLLTLTYRRRCARMVSANQPFRE